MQEAVQTGAAAGLTIIESSLLGALLVLCVAVAVASVMLAYKTQTKRVEDQKRAAERMAKLAQEQGALNTQMSNTIERLLDSERTRDAKIDSLLQGQANLMTVLASRGS